MYVFFVCVLLFNVCYRCKYVYLYVVYTLYVFHLFIFIDVNMFICMWSINVCVSFLYFFIHV